MPQVIALILGVIFVLIGLVQTFISLHEWFRDKMLLRTGSETNGTVIDEVTYPSDDNLQTGQYRYIVRYFVDNSAYHVSSRFSGRKHEYLKRYVPIVYDPAFPERSRFKYDRDLRHDVLKHVLILAIGVGLVIYGLL